MNLDERKNQWRDKIERCLSSGMPIKRWCELNKVAPSSLYAWMARFRKEQSDLLPEQTATEWIEITKESLANSVAMVPTTAKTNLETHRTTTMPTKPLTQSTKMICAYVNGIELSISSGCEESDISAVFKAAMSL